MGSGNNQALFCAVPWTFGVGGSGSCFQPQGRQAHWSDHTLQNEPRFVIRLGREVASLRDTANAGRGRARLPSLSL